MSAEFKISLGKTFLFVVTLSFIRVFLGFEDAVITGLTIIFIESL